MYKIMLSYYLKCRKNTESKSPKVANMENNAFIQICCVSQKKIEFSETSRRAGRLLSNLTRIKVPILSD